MALVSEETMREVAASLVTTTAALAKLVTGGEADVVNLLGAAGTASPAAAGHSESTAVTGLGVYRAYTLIGDLVGATGGVLDVVVETSPNGTHWYEFARFTQKAAASAATSEHIDPVLDGKAVIVGMDLTTTFVLAQATCKNGILFDQARVRMVAGSGTSAGATQKVTLVGVRNPA
jgi:hypothetical protein